MQGKGMRGADELGKEWGDLDTSFRSLDFL